MDDTTWNDICEDRLEVLTDNITALNFELETYRNLISIQNDRIVSLECSVHALKVRTIMDALFNASDDEVHSVIMSLGDN